MVSAWPNKMWLTASTRCMESDARPPAISRAMGAEWTFGGSGDPRAQPTQADAAAAAPAVALRSSLRFIALAVYSATKTPLGVIFSA